MTKGFWAGFEKAASGKGALLGAAAGGLLGGAAGALKPAHKELFDGKKDSAFNLKGALIGGGAGAALGAGAGHLISKGMGAPRAASLARSRGAGTKKELRGIKQWQQEAKLENKNNSLQKKIKKLEAQALDHRRESRYSGLRAGHLSKKIQKDSGRSTAPGHIEILKGKRVRALTMKKTRLNSAQKIEEALKALKQKQANLGK
jgi:hypothetical protein